MKTVAGLPIQFLSEDRLWAESKGGNVSILLKNSIPDFRAGFLEVSHHHPTRLRRTERVLEGGLLRGHSVLLLRRSFSTE